MHSGTVADQPPTGSLVLKPLTVCHDLVIPCPFPSPFGKICPACGTTPSSCVHRCRTGQRRRGLAVPAGNAGDGTEIRARTPAPSGAFESGSSSPTQPDARKYPQRNSRMHSRVSFFLKSGYQPFQNPFLRASCRYPCGSSTTARSSFA